MAQQENKNPLITAADTMKPLWWDSSSPFDPLRPLGAYDARKTEDAPRKPLFAPEGQGDNIYPQKGMILLHKKSEHDHVMSYVVEGVYQYTEGDRPSMVAYRALYDTKGEYEGHVRPWEMFTTDRFVAVGNVNDIIALMKG